MWLICCCWHIAHARLCSTGGWGGLTTFLTTLRQGPRNLLPLLTCWGWGGTDNVLDDFETGSTGLVAVLDASRREKKRNGWASDGLHSKHGNHEFLIFFCTRRSKLTHGAGETQFFELESHACQSKHFERVPQLPAFCLLASKISISNLSPLQGRRIKRLPSFRWF